MIYSLHFEPFLTAAPLVCLGIAALLITGYSCLRRIKGSVLRLLAAGFFIALLCNPILLQETREQETSIVAVIVDNSASQKFGTRTQDTAQALAQLRQKLSAVPKLETRIIETAKQDADKIGDRQETRIFAPLRDALADIPPSRIAGAILLTDGQISDIPSLSPRASAEEITAKLGFAAPVNALISGSAQEYNRRIRFVKAPRFGLKGKELSLSFLVQDEGAPPSDQTQSTVLAELFINGEQQGQYPAHLGAETEIAVTLQHSGSNIIELKIPSPPGQVTNINNRAAVIIDAVRENLNVLLVSGEPHNGLRLWRDLLKSDTGVDLVHFTILRPPEKQDSTPTRQLSLIVFPTTDLFVNRLQDFDLIIFDRYQHYDVLPLIYYDYIVQYVENGGALLMAVGPEFAGGASLALTPLARILPARPTGNVLEKPFLPKISAQGKTHPVTQNLEGGGAEFTASKPQWGRWLRQIEADIDDDGAIIMQGADDKPLLVLAHKGEGRVAMLLSDEGWLWQRGYEGGGPYAALYRRIAHWLMKEPDLEEERLSARAQGHKIFLERRSGQPAVIQAMTDAFSAARSHSSLNPKEKETAPPNKQNSDGLFHITLPSGKTLALPPKDVKNGIFSCDFISAESGLIRIAAGGKSAFIYAGAPDTPEFADIIATGSKLAPIAAATGGQILPMHKTAGDAVQIGGINMVSAKTGAGAPQKSGALTLQASSDTRVESQNKQPLLLNFYGLTVALALFALIWRREARG